MSERKNGGPSLLAVLTGATLLFGGFCGGLTYTVGAATAKPKPFVPPPPRMGVRPLNQRPLPPPGGATSLPVPAGTTLAANGATVEWSALGAGVQTIQLTGTWTATVQFEATNDPVTPTWEALRVMNAATDAVVTSATGNGTWVAPGGRLRYRLRISAFTSGSVVPFVFADDGSNLVRVLNSAGGGGGGAVTVADGADVAQGTTTDAGITTDIAGTLVGFARGNIKQWNTYLARFPAALTGSGNLKVALAESTASQAVTGTITGNQGSQNAGGTANAWFMQGALANAAAVAGNPVLVAGSDGANVRNFLTDTSGRQQVVGTAAAAAAVSGNPLVIGGRDGSGNAQYIGGNNSGLFVQGSVASAAAGLASVNPVAVGGVASDGTTARYLSLNTTGGNDTFTNSVNSLFCMSFTQGYNGATWERLRVATVFKTVSLGAGTTETTIWTPTAGKKFRFMGFHLTSGAASTLTFKDNTAGTTIFISRGTTDQPQDWQAPQSDGILSAAANNVLTVTRGTSSTLDGEVWGTEE